MNITDTFIRRPVMTTLVMLGFLGFGLMAYFQLPVSDLPSVDYPVIHVSAGLPGASPETMASAVATPLEKEFSAIAGLNSMSSSSSLGRTSISLQFELSRDIDSAAQDVQAAISRAQRNLPSDMPSPPSYRKENPGDHPILYVALTSPTLPLYTLDEYAETMMAQRISTVSGVSMVQVYGSQKYAVRIKLNPHELASKGIALSTVAQKIQGANVNMATGDLQGPNHAFTIKATGQLTEAKGYRNIIVRSDTSGKIVRLAELGTVEDSVENDKTAAWYGDSGNIERSIVLAIKRQPGTNTIAVVNRVRDLLPTFAKQLPAAVSMHILYDRSQTIRASVNDVQFTLVLTLGLVIMVIFLFLRNVRATVIPSLAMPLSIVGTFAFMYMFGYSLNNLSLMALVLAVGFVVDDAIVMLENVVRHIEMGKPPMQAAFDGAREIGFTILSMTFSLAAVFIPMLFMGGLVGRLFHEFAVTIAAAILISGLVSLTLTPMLCSRFLKDQHEVHHGHIFLASEKVFNAGLWLYEVGLRFVLRHRLSTMALSLAILVGMGYLFTLVPKGFLPSEDQGQLFAITQAAEGISFDALKEHQQALAEIARKDPNVESVMSFCGSGGPSGSNGGMIFMKLKPRDQRELSADEIIPELRRKTSQVPGIIMFTQNPPPINLSGRFSKAQYQFTLQGSDTTELYKYAPMLERKLKSMPGFKDVTTDLELSSPQVNVVIDRSKAESMHVSAMDIESALASAYGAQQISTIYAPNNEYEVIMELQPRFQRDPDSLSLLYVKSASGSLVPLDTLVDFNKGLGPLTINHQGQLPAVTVSFNLGEGYAIGDATSTVDRLAMEMLPQTISASFQGDAAVFQQSLNSLGILLVMALLVIYLVLGILYESFIHPITIFSGLPFAGFGALLTLWIFGAHLDLYAFVGIIMLVGLVKKNGIMMIDFAIQSQREQGKEPMDAIYEACVIRFRPIMMTTFAALMGTLPIAVGFGAGAEARRPLGLAVVGGLLFSQLLTLFVTPVVYVYMESFRHFMGRLFGASPKALPSGTTPAADHALSGTPAPVEA